MKKMIKKIFAFTICLDLVILLTVGVTLTYIFATSKEVKNTFTPPKPDSVVVEDFPEQLIKKDVKIQVKNDDNAGVKSYIRAEVVVTWQEQTAGEDNIFSIIPAEKEDYEITYNLNSKADDGEWFLGEDGFYYFTEPVDPGEYTDVLIVEAKQVRAAPAGYYLHIEILGQSIQAEPTQAAAESWLVTIDGTKITGPRAVTQSE